MPRPSNPHMRQKILAVAADLFFQQGFYKVPIAALVATLRTSKSAIYKHFQSKEALVAALVDNFNAEVDQHLEQIVSGHGLDFREKLGAVTAHTCQVLSRVRQPFFHDLRIHTPSLWQRYETSRQRRLDSYYRVLFEEGVHQGQIRNDMPIDFVLILYTQMTEVLIRPDSLQDLALSNKQAYEMITTLFLEGALSPTGTDDLSNEFFTIREMG